MGCNGSVYYHQQRSVIRNSHDENDIVNVGELDGHKFKNHYYDNKNDVMLTMKNGCYYSMEFITLNENKMYLLTNDNGQKIMYGSSIKDKMKKKFYDELKNKVRREIMNEKQNSKDLLLK